MARRRTWWSNAALRQAILTGEWGWWLPGSQLDLDFAHDRAFNRSTGFNGSPNSLLTYTSPSPKLVYGDDGVLGYAPHNLLLQSQNISSLTAPSTTTLSDMVVSANQTTAPDGTLTADLLTPNAGTLAKRLRLNSASGVYTYSFYVKSNGIRYLNLGYSTSTRNAAFDIVDGLVTQQTTDVVGVSTITDVGDGWFRITYPRNGSDFYLTVVDDYTRQAVAFAATCNGTDGFYLWGAQLNNGAEALTYVPTTTAAVYSLPIDHDPTTFEPLGVLIEEQRTNLCIYASDFTNAAWTKTNLTVTASALSAKGLSFSKLNATSAAATRCSQAITATSTSQTYSIFVTKGSGATEANEFLIRNNTTATNLLFIAFNFDTGEITYVTGASGASAQNLGDGVWRVILTVTSGITAGNDIWVYAGFSGSAETANTHLYATGAQLEAGAFATSYIPTVASQVTRAADQVSILTSAFGYSATAGTMRTQAMLQALPTASQFNPLWNIRVQADATTKVEQFVRHTTGSTRLFVRTSAVTQVDLGSGIVTVGTEFTTATAWAQDDYAMCFNGGVVGTYPTGNLGSGLNILNIGSGGPGGSGQTTGHIKRLTYFPTRRTNSDLQVLST